MGIQLVPATLSLRLSMAHRPYRGCHTFLRAVPDILHRHPCAHVVVVGSTEGVSYGSSSCDSWRDVFSRRLKASLILSGYILRVLSFMHLFEPTSD